MLLEGLSLTALADGVGFSDQLGNIRQSLLSLGLLLIVAKLAEGVFRRLHLNSILPTPRRASSWDRCSRR